MARPPGTVYASEGIHSLVFASFGLSSGGAKGVVINEFSDALGTGNFIYEFIELHNDK